MNRRINHDIILRQYRLRSIDGVMIFITIRGHRKNNEDSDRNKNRFKSFTSKGFKQSKRWFSNSRDEMQRIRKFAAAYRAFAMKKKKKQQTSFDVAKNLQRKLAIQQGFYDGRFKEKIVKDKKKEYKKKLARKKVDIRKEE